MTTSHAPTDRASDELRRFRAPTIEAALTEARADLGDVEIVEANRIRRGGVGGFFATDLGVELVVRLAGGERGDGGTAGIDATWLADDEYVDTAAVSLPRSTTVVDGTTPASGREPITAELERLLIAATEAEQARRDGERRAVRTFAEHLAEQLGGDPSSDRPTGDDPRANARDAAPSKPADSHRDRTPASVDDEPAPNRDVEPRRTERAATEPRTAATSDQIADRQRAERDDQHLQPLGRRQQPAPDRADRPAVRRPAAELADEPSGDRRNGDRRPSETRHEKVRAESEAERSVGDAAAEARPARQQRRAEPAQRQASSRRRSTTDEGAKVQVEVVEQAAPVAPAGAAPSRRRAKSPRTPSGADPWRKSIDLAAGAVGRLVEQLSDVTPVEGSRMRSLSRLTISVTTPDGAVIELTADLDGSDG